METLAAIGTGLPSLQALTLDLSGGNGLGPAATAVLATLGTSCTLETLVLRLTGAPLGKEGALALASLSDTPGLTALSLDLVGCGLECEGAAALATLGRAPRLRSLTLALRNNRIRDDGAQAFCHALLEPLPALTALVLDLRGNTLGLPAAQALGGLGDQLPSLSTLELHLGAIHGEGAVARLDPTPNPSLSPAPPTLTHGGNMERWCQARPTTPRLGACQDGALPGIPARQSHP